MKRILILYVTRTQTTQLAAEIIAEVLKRENHEVTVAPIAEAVKLETYDAVVIGAPINGMQWHPTAQAYVQDHQEVLREKTTALFFMSYLIGAGRKIVNTRIEKSLDTASAAVHPVLLGMFKGVSGEKGLPRFIRWLFGIKADVPVDRREDSEVIEWAERFEKMLHDPA